MLTYTVYAPLFAQFRLALHPLIEMLNRLSEAPKTLHMLCKFRNPGQFGPGVGDTIGILARCVILYATRACEAVHLVGE